MDPITFFFQQLLNGLQTGSIYALVALGYTMVYGIVRLINFAHGDFIMVGGYLTLIAIPAALSLGVPAWAAVVPAVVGCAALGFVTEKVAYKPLRGAARLSALITAIGVSLLLENLFLLIFGAAPRSFPNIFHLPALVLGGVRVSGTTLVTIVLSLCIMALLTLFVQRTRLGRAMRAVSEDASAAALMGVNVNGTISLTFSLGAGLAAVAALMYCAAYPQVNPYMGSMLGLRAFIAAVFGGIGILPGAMLGGILIGVIESLSKAYISSQLADAIVFGLLIVLLLLKPTGIFGKNTGEKV